MRQRRPCIGITTSAHDERGHFHLDTEYVEAVQRAGAIALLIPPGQEPADEVLAVVDALVLSGGGDVDPRLYGGTAHPTIHAVDAARDASELALARAVLAAGTPCLCICRGMQILNVAAGGTLVEHLPDECDGSVAHKGDEQFVDHALDVAPRSRLGAILAQARVTAPSWHHQAVRALAPGFEVAARAPDGTIEAMESPKHPRLVAVQWHPEHSAARDALQQRLFDWLASVAR